MRKYDVDYVLGLEYKEAVDLIKYALDQDLEDRLFQMWNMERLHHEEPISFNDYKDLYVKKEITTKSTSELKAELDEIENSFRKE